MKTYPTGIVNIINNPKPKHPATIKLDSNKLVNIESDSGCVVPRTGGNFSGKGFFLSKTYDWSIIKDNMNSIVLVPTNK